MDRWTRLAGCARRAYKWFYSVRSMEISLELAKLIGIHMGDGCISVTDKYSEYALSGDITEEVEYYDNYIVPLYNKLIFQPLIRKNIFPKRYEKNSSYGFFVFNKTVVDFFLKLGLKKGSKLDMEIPFEIRNNPKLWPYFLRGIFDTDGTLYFNKNYSVKKQNQRHNQARIRLGLTSKKVIEQIYSMLTKLDFHPYLKPAYKGKRDLNPIYSIMIQRKGEVIRFINEIGFDSIKHLTKWQIYQKCSYCPPHTTLAQRYELLLPKKQTKDL